MNRSPLFCLLVAVGSLLAGGPGALAGEAAPGPVLGRAEALAALQERLPQESAEGWQIHPFPDKAGPSFHVALGRGELTLPGGPGWAFFVDDHPQANWEHPCRYVMVGEDGQLTVVHATRPPKELPAFAQPVPPKAWGRAPDPALADPVLITSAGAPLPGDVPAEHRYAVILSGGVSTWNNSQRYWDDCSFFYTTLKQNGFLDENIYVLMGDGTDPADDAVWVFGRQATGGYIWDIISSPLDLDGDGRADIRYGANRADFGTVFSELEARLDERDMLFLFVTDHGGLNSGSDSPYPSPAVSISLWGEETLFAEELAAAVDRVGAGTVVGLFAQCYSGGFVEKLAGPRRVLLSACRWWESSFAGGWNGFRYAYDEFAHNATVALADPGRGDFSGDGRTSMEETYLYTLANGENQDDGAGNSEHSDYFSEPWDLGRKVTLRGIRPEGSEPVCAGYVQVQLAEPYPELGEAMGWHADDATWEYPLPFPFPFGDRWFRSVHVSSNGILFFASPSDSGNNSPQGLAQATAVAPLWDDLTTEDPDTDIFVEATTEQATFAWSARTKADGRPVNTAARLHPDGRIVFYYGEGNDHSGWVEGREKTIGISTGGIPHFSLRNGASRLGGAAPVAFLPTRSRIRAGEAGDSPRGWPDRTPVDEGGDAGCIVRP